MSASGNAFLPRETEFIILGYGRNKSEEIAAQPMNQVVFRALGLRVPAVHRGRRLRRRPPGGGERGMGFRIFLKNLTAAAASGGGGGGVVILFAL